jgi:hypothetical protein
VLTLQVVAFQAMMEVMAEKFPGAFSGYTLKVCHTGCTCTACRLQAQLFTYMGCRGWHGVCLDTGALGIS